jgi:hypothetical protein
VDASQLPLLLKVAQIAADRDHRDAELFSKLIGGHGAPQAELSQNDGVSGVLEHG